MATPESNYDWPQLQRRKKQSCAEAWLRQATAAFRASSRRRLFMTTTTVLPS